MGKIVSKKPKDESKAGHKRRELKAKTGNSNKKRKTSGGPDAPSSTTTSPGGSSEKWSKSKKKRMRKMMAKQETDTSKATKNSNNNDGTTLHDNTSSDSLTLPTTTTTTTTTNSSSKNNNSNRNSKNSVQDAFKARLAGSRFRILNEELYTNTSTNSYDKFKANPELFEQYHDGFRHQVESWPENPVDIMVNSLTTTYKNKKTTTPFVVADFGCGEAELAKDLSNIKRTQPKQNSKKKKKSGEEDDEDDDDDNDEQLLFKVHSFDLVSPNKFVTACDMSNVPLEDKSVDVCVFCLSLMGTNLADFIREAHRVLKNDGRVQIAEVRSRIEYSFSKKGAPKATTKNNTNNNKNYKNNKESDKNSTKVEKTEGTLDEFIGVLGKLGFECVRTDRTNTMFLLLELKKNGKNPSKKLEFSAKPCIYKRR